MAATDTTETTTHHKKTQSHPDPIILDLGRKKRKAVKRLRNGKGRLFDEVSLAIDELRTAGTIGAAAQPVIVIVREKRISSMFPMVKL